MKHTLKVIFILLSLPFYLLLLIMPSAHRKAMFSTISQCLSIIPGKTGSFYRKAFYQLSMKQCHFNGVISFGTLFSDTDTEIDKNVYIGPQCNIGKCAIGKNTLIASGVHILSGKNQHNFSDLDTPIQQQGGNYQKINIGEDCWIGNTAVIMANVGKKSIVAAGAVVVHDVADYSIVAGNPAKVIKSRQ